jgi:hypothetical protein
VRARRRPQPPALPPASQRFAAWPDELAVALDIQRGGQCITPRPSPSRANSCLTILPRGPPHPPPSPPLPHASTAWHAGEHLDPLDVLHALPPSMPLCAAVDVAAPMLRDRIHRRRAASLLKNIHSARLTAARVEQSAAEAGRVVVDEERACPKCHLRLGGKVFVVLQQPQGGCDSVSGLQQQQQQQQGGAAGPVSSSALHVVCYNCYRKGLPRSVDGGKGVLGPKLVTA